MQSFNSKFIFTCLFLVIFLITLRSVYFYSISLAPFPVVGVLLALSIPFLNVGGGFNYIQLRVLLAFFVFLLISFIPTIIYGNVYLNSVIGVVLNLLLMASIFYKETLYYNLIKVINSVLFVHLIFFFIQFFVYHFSGEKIDYLEPITGEAQRMVGFEKIEAGGFSLFRPAGLFNEPSTYSVFMITLLWCVKVAGKENILIEKMTLVSILFTFSLSGIIFAIAYYVLQYYKRIKFFEVLVLLLISFVILLLFGDLFYAYFEHRVMNISNDNSANERLLMFQLFYDLDASYQLFGSGIGNDIIDIALTTVPSIFIYFGVVGATIFILLILYSCFSHKVSIESAIFSILITFNFYKISNTYVWLYFILLLIVSRGRFLEVKNEAS